MPPDLQSARPTRLIGLLILGGALLFITRPSIQTKERSAFRLLLWIAWYLAGAGLLLVAMGSVLTYFAGSHTAGYYLGITGFNVLILGPLSVAFVGWLIKLAGTWRVIATSSLLVISLLALPPLVVLLVTGERPYYLLGPQATGAAADSEEFVVLIILITAVILGPIYISTWRSWDKASKSTRRLLPETMATIATSATIIYAVILHASKGPLDNSSVTKVIITGLVAAVFLRPLYRYLAMACWRWGPAEVFLIQHWRSDQMKMLRELYGSWKAVELHSGNPAKSSDLTERQHGDSSGVATRTT